MSENANQNVGSGESPAPSEPAETPAPDQGPVSEEPLDFADPVESPAPPQGAGSGETIGSSEPVDNPALQKDPSDWSTGEEPMTEAQRSYLDTLARQAGEELPADLTKAQASEHIDRLQSQTGRGQGS